MQPAGLCPNCETEAPGRYCPQCGQRQLGRLSLKHIGHEFLSRFFGAKRGFWRMFVALTLHPGKPARDYIDGRRQRHLSPMMWYIVGATLQVLGFLLIREEVTAATVNALPDPLYAHLQSKGIEQPREFVGDLYLTVIQSSYSWLGLFTFVLPMALLLRVLVGRRINFAEALVLALNSIGHMMLITAFTAQVCIRVSPELQVYFSLSLYVVYAVATAAGCLGWTWRPIVAGLLAMAIACTLFVLSIGFVFGIALGSSL